MLAPPSSFSGSIEALGIGVLPMPPALCLPTSMTLAFAYDENNDPALWTIPPVAVSPPSQCVGYQLDTLNRVGEGPLCVAVVASDKAGNVNVSPPLRLCVDGPNHRCTAWPPATLPSCTGRLVTTTNPPTVDATAPCTVSPLYPAIGDYVTLN
jgi:hypothetical protein